MNPQELDRFCELANIGAGHAATAFSQLVGTTIRMQPPQVHEICDQAPMSSAGSADQLSSGVFFQLEGCLDAMVCILFRAPECEAVVRRVLGGWTNELSDENIESVIRELGNILASHLASAIADTIGGRLLPSVPSLAMDDAFREFVSRAGDRVGEDRVRIDCALSDGQGEVGALILVVPGAAST